MTTATKPSANDRQYEEVTVESVERESSGGWSIKRSDGWSFWAQADSPIEPKPGMTARFYGKGIGFTVRGLVLDGVTVFYRTEAEEEARHQEWCDQKDRDRRAWFEANKDDLDRRVAVLPEVFRRRIDRFRAGNPDFRWEHESYELFCCEQAVVIADALGTPEKFREVVGYGSIEGRWDAIKAAVPGLDDGHSGNTFGAAVSLASYYLNSPENVVRQHGAMTPVVGCKAYGCTHGTEGLRP